MILPVIDYGDIFYHNTNASLLKKLQVIQNKCMRIISRLPRLANTVGEERKLDLVPLCERSLHIIQFAYELVINQSNVLEKYHLESTPDRIITRSQDPGRKQITMFRPTKSLIKKSISYTMRNPGMKLPTVAHPCADKHNLTKFLLANSNDLQK